MATYVVNSTNWNSASFWAGIVESGGGHTLDFSGLGIGFSVIVDQGTGIITLSDGATTFTVGEAGVSGVDVNLGGTTQLDYFTTISGAQGGDTVTGTSGDDVLDGNSGADSLAGNDGADTVYGNGGADTLDGGAGNDRIHAGADGDSITGGDGDDQLYGETGNDTIYGGTGDDVIDGGTGDDVIDAGLGSDRINLTDAFGDDTIIGGEDGGGLDIDTIDASGITTGGVIVNVSDETGSVVQGADSVNFSGIESFVLTDQADRFTAFGMSAVTLDGGGGNDTITEGNGDNNLSGGDGDDLFEVGLGTSTIDGGTGTDTLSAAVSNDRFSVTFDGTGSGTYEDLTDTDSGTFTSIEAVRGSGGADSINAGADAGGVQLSGGAGNDTITGGSGEDVIAGDADADIISGGASSDILFGGAGDDLIRGDVIDFDPLAHASGPGGASTVFTVQNTSDTAVRVYWINQSGTLVNYGFISAGGSGSFGTFVDHNWVLYDAATNQPLQYLGHPANGSIVTYAQGDDQLYGGVGNDTLQGDHGDDTLDGGAGNDILSGGAGSDRFVFSDGFGADTVIGGQGYDTLDLTGLANPVSVVFSGPGAGTITDTVTGETITFSNVEELILTQQADLVDAALDNGYTYIQTRGGNDLIEGSAGNDIYDDEIAGPDGQGNDTFFGGAGNDTLWMGTDDDLVYGGTGDDYLQGQSGHDSLYGDDGNDSLWGGEGDDVLIGGAGNDSLSGGADADRFFLDDGFGADTIAGGEDGRDADVIDASELDTATTVTFTGSEAGTISAGGGTADFTQVEAISLGNQGDTLDASVAAAPVVVAGGAGSDTMSGGAGGDLLIGDGEYTNLIQNGSFENTTGMTVTSWGYRGDDATAPGGWYTGTGGVIDVHHTGAGAASDGSNWLDMEGVAAIDTVSQAVQGVIAGQTYTLRFDAIDAIGNNAVNVFWNGQLIDTVAPGSAGHQTYRYEVVGGSGDGSDILTFQSLGPIDMTGVAIDNVQLLGFSSVDVAAGADVLDGGAGDDMLIGGGGDDRLVGRSGEDVLYGGAGNDTIQAGSDDDTLEGGLGDDVLYGEDGADQIAGGAGNDTLHGGDSQDTLMGEAGNDHLHGEQGDDLLFGGAGNDTLRGNAGADSLFGGDDDDLVWAGLDNDRIEGGAGNDTAVFAGDVTDYSFDYGPAGELIVTDLVADRDGQDTLSGFEYAIFNGVTYHLVLGDDGSNTTLQGPDDGTPSLIIAHDGNDWGGGHPTSDAIFGGAGDDTLDGGDGDDTLVGEDGNDLLRGDAGNDSLIGGAGADTLAGGTGNDRIDPGQDGMADVIVFSDGDGQDTITGLDAPVDNGDGTFTGVDRLDVSGLTDANGGRVSTDDVTVSDDGAGNAVLSFPNGESLTLEGISPATAGNPAWLEALGIPQPDYLVSGTAGSDLIDAGYTGDPQGDMVDAGDAADGSNDDSIRAGEGDDTVFAGEGADTVAGDDGNDQIYGGTGNDSLFGAPGSDTIFGQDGDDTLFGGQGDDVLDGDDANAGNDQISGNAGNDEIIGDGGNDTLFGGAGNDTIYAGADDDSVFGGADDDLVFAGSGNDTVNGDDGNDVVYGEGGADSIEGGLGDDWLSGDADNDTLLGGDGNDTILAGDGADQLDGGTGADTLDGGAGDDTIAGGAGSDLAYGGAGNDFINTRMTFGLGSPDRGYPGAFPADSDPDNDRDSIHGGEGDDTVLSGDDNDLIFGGEGADSLDAGFDDDTVQGDQGADTIIGGEGRDLIHGGDDDDLLYGDAFAGHSEYFELTDADGSDLRPDNSLDTVYGGTGNDVIYGGDDDDELYGGDGDDQLFGDVDDDTLHGDAGNDMLFGGQGDDQLAGGDGADELDGGAGADTLDGGAGDDTIRVGDGDAASGGGGDDTFIVTPDTLNGGTLFIDGGETDETAGDTLHITGPANIVYDGANPENGTVTWLDGSVLTFQNIENITYVPCFTEATLIKTRRGEVPAAQLRLGDMVLTRNHGYQPIRWIGTRRLDAAQLRANPALNPVVIRAGALGFNAPERDLTVSPQHRMLIGGGRAQLWFGEDEVFVAAHHLDCLDGVEQIRPDAVTYVHVMFDTHQIISGDGAWSESFQPGDLTLSGMDDDQRAELLAIFPELFVGKAGQTYQAARITLKKHEVPLLFI
jgi:Ca2+-binding RTX toxin-like protein